MAGETVITVVGNLTADPEIRTIGSGAAVASFTIASTPRTWNRNSNQFEDGQALFLRCSAWRDMAEHCAQSLSKGMRVIAQGRLQQRSYPRRRTVPSEPSSRCRSTKSARPCATRPPTVTRQSSSGNGGFSGNRGGYNNANNNGGFGGNNGGYQGGSSYAGGAGYQGGASAPVNAAPAQSAPASDPWSSSDNSGSSFGSFGASQSFGGSSEFGGDSDEPEF